MEKREMQSLQSSLEKLEEQQVKIEQTGFINCKFTIHKFAYEIAYDILLLQCQKGNIRMSLNLNQVYKSETTNEYILLYLDNDIKIKIIK